MKKILILCCAVLTLCMAHAQWPNVSTGISTTGAALNFNVPDQDPNWYLGTPNPIPSTATYVQQYISGAWNPTPIAGTNAGWINPSTTPGNDVPGVYAFERKFTIYPNTCSFNTNFKIAEDDSLVSLELIPPAGPSIPLTVVLTNHVNPQYFLSQLIKKKITCPQTGVWTIIARIHYIDQIGGFLLSGRIDTTANGCTCRCDSTCKLNLTVGGVSGSPFSCGNTIKLKCKNTYDFNPHFDCKDSGSATSVISITLTDASNNTPVWATTFIVNNGAGSLSIPGGIPAGIYTLTYTYGVNGKKCGTCKFKLNISCKCKCTLNTTVNINGVITHLVCGDTIALRCNNRYKFTPHLNCTNDSITHLTGVSVVNSAGQTPTWANPFIANGGNAVLNIPNNISGIFTITYYWGANGGICDSCKYYIKVTCGCNCNLSLIYEGNGSVDTVTCGDTVKAVCGTNTSYSPSLNCTDSTTQFIGFSLTDANGNVPAWAANFNGTGAFGVPANLSGIFTLTYIWGSPDGTPCDSCKIYLSVICCPPTPCTLTTSIAFPPRGKLLYFNCRDTASLRCGYNYTFSAILHCNNSSQTQLTYVTLHDAGGNTPSWANTFLSNLGNGTLSIPNNLTGYYTLKYYWGLGSLICDSCSYILNIQCCTLAVNAGPDLVTCCSSAGTQLNAIITGIYSFYSISWSPTTGLSNPFIANPICTTTGTYIITVTDAICSKSDTIKISYSGVNCCRMAGNKTKAQVYPNPFKNGFTIKLPVNTIADIKLVNMQGLPQEIKTNASGKFELGKTLSYGVYTILIQYNDGTREELKVIKNPK